MMIQFNRLFLTNEFQIKLSKQIIKEREICTFITLWIYQGVWFVNIRIELYKPGGMYMKAYINRLFDSSTIHDIPFKKTKKKEKNPLQVRYVWSILNN